MQSANVAFAESAVLPERYSPDDKRRFSSVVLPHLASAYALARWLTGSHADAQDVIQEASIRALRGIGKFANGNAQAWLLTIVRNTAFDWLPKNRPAALVFIDNLENLECAPPDASVTAAPEAALMKIEDETQLASAISALPSHYREALVLRDVEGLSYRKIAEQTGVAIGTMMSRLFRARRQLIALMGPSATGAKCGAGTRPRRPTRTALSALLTLPSPPPMKPTSCGLAVEG
jgi:RNA polymerase sigma factor (sigma-70 family)